VAGKKYYKILGLSESASKKEVKRKYKKLVKKCHPDINPDPKAHDEFILITEAYDFLMESERSKKKSSKSTTTTKKSSFEEYRERSRKIFEKRQKRKKKEIEQFYISLRAGWRRNLIWANAIVGVFIFLFMTADRVAEPRFKTIHVVNTSPYEYHSIGRHQVQEVTCSNGNSYFLADFIGIENLKYHPKLLLKESRFLHHPIAVSQSYRKVVKHAQIHFTLYWAYPLVSLFLFLPWIVLLYRKNNAGFVFLHYSSLILTSPFLLYILLTGHHILHIFTLGTL